MQLRGKTVLTVLMGVLFLSAVLGLPAIFAQAPPTTTKPAAGQEKKEEYDTPYTEEEYAAYEKAVNEPDLLKKKQLLVQFTEANPKSALLAHITPAYQQVMQTLMKNNLEAKKYQDLTVIAEEYLVKYPNDLLAIAMAAEGYRGLKNYAKFIEFGQKVYAAKPDPGTAYYITQAYDGMKDMVKYMEWAQKTMELLPDNIQYQLEFLPRIGSYFFDQKQLEKAAAIERKLLPVLDKATKPATTTDAEWKTYLNNLRTAANSMIGEALFQKDNFKEALTSFQKVVAFSKKNDLAYYRIGSCYWKLNDPDNAIEAYAKAYVLNGGTSKSAYESLEKLYKAIHNNSTIGINKVLDQAKKDLAL